MISISFSEAYTQIVNYNYKLKILFINQVGKYFFTSRSGGNRWYINVYRGSLNITRLMVRKLLPKA